MRVSRVFPLILATCILSTAIPSQVYAARKTQRESVAELYRRNERVTPFNRLTDSLATIGSSEKEAQEIIAKRRQLRKQRRFNAEQKKASQEAQARRSAR